MKESIVAVLQIHGKSGDLQLDAKPAVLLIVGVNGGGKTTTIGKLAHKFGNEGAKACQSSTWSCGFTMYHSPRQLAANMDAPSMVISSYGGTAWHAAQKHSARGMSPAK